MRTVLLVQRSGRRDHQDRRHRIGAIEVETSFCVIRPAPSGGQAPDDLRGEVISAFVVLRQGYAPSDESSGAARHCPGRARPSAVISDLRFVSMLPKTRSGRSCAGLKAIVMGNDVGDVSTIEDEARSRKP